MPPRPVENLPKGPANWLTHQRAIHAVKQLAARFEARNIPVVPVKGLALAPLLYQDPIERPMVDADLLVPRSRLPEARDIVREAGWRIAYQSYELGELCFWIDGFPVELHGEMGRPNLTAMTVDEVVARGRSDTGALGFPILRIDDIDHLILVATNVVKDMFVDAPAHTREDLRRLVRRVNADEVVERTRRARFATAMCLVAHWMTKGGDAGFAPIEAALRPFRRRVYSASVRGVAELRSRFDGSDEARRKAWSPVRVAAFALACASCDDLAIRSRCLATLARRVGRRGLGFPADSAAALKASSHP